MIKTCVIWDECAVNPIRFFVVEGNKSHWDNVYLNTYTDDPELQKNIDDLLEFMYPEEYQDVNPNIDWYDHFPYGGYDFVIVAGQLP